MARQKLKGASNQLVDPDLKKQFIEMRDHWAGLDQRANSAAGKRRQYEKEAKSAGFSKSMFKDSLRMSTPEGEAEFRAEIANRLLAAAYSDADIGDQLGLFLDNNRTPAVDRAYREGQTQAMENRAMETKKYAPDTEQYRAFVTGYQEEQERQILQGIKKKEDTPSPQKGAKRGPKGKKAEAAAPAAGKRRGRPPGSGKKASGEAPAARAAKDDAPPRRPSAQPVTRATLAAQQTDAAEADEGSYFSKSIN